MTITAVVTPGKTLVNFATGSHFDDAVTPAALVVTCGFKPRYIRVVNLTDRVQYEWFDGMADANALKQVAAGTGTFETSATLTPGERGFTLAAAAVLQNKQYFWQAQE